METLDRIRYIESKHTDLRRDVFPKYPSYITLLQWMFRWIGPLFPGAFGKLAFRLFTTPLRRARHRLSDVVMEKARLFDFMSGSYILKGYEWGSGEEIVLLIHGWESRGTAMRSLVRPLVKQGYKVVTFDAPAHGDSAGKRTNLRTYSEAVKAIINKYGGVTHIVSHSFGGGAAMFALAHYDIPAVQRFVMTAAPSSMKTIFDQFSSLMGLPKSVRNALMKTVKKIIKVPLEQMDGRDIEALVKLSDLLIIHDENDKIVPINEAREFIKKWRKGELLITKGLGHFRILKNPDVIAEIISFLKST